MQLVVARSIFAAGFIEAGTELREESVSLRREFFCLEKNIIAVDKGCCWMIRNSFLAEMFLVFKIALC